jgi:two-component system sensor histidine kinase YesM
MRVPGRNRRHSLWLKVFVVIFLFLMVPSLGFTYFSNRITTDSLMEQKRQSDLRTIHELITILTQYSASVEDDALLIGSMPEVKQALRDRPADVSAITSNLSGKLRGIAAISLMDPAGRFIGETKLTVGRLSWFFNPSLLRKLSPDAPMWTDPFTIEEVATGAQHRVQALIAPVKDQSGALQGYVVQYMDTEYIRGLIQKTDGDLYVVDAAQCVVASREEVPYFEPLFDITKISYTLMMEDASAIVSVEGENKFVTTQMFSPMKLQFVMISSFNSISGMLAVYYSKIVLMALAGLLFALIAALIIARFFTRRIVNLKGLMARATEGDLTVRYQARSHDEVDQLGGAFNTFLDTIQQLMQQKIDEQKRKRKLQLQLLQEQVKPHFLYNVLEMISSLVQCGMSREALGAILSLARFYRISLSSGSDIIGIDQEVQLTESYLALQKLRYIEFMDYKLAVDPNLLTFAIPKLTLQPLVENAIYHGLKAKRPRGILSVSGVLSGDEAVFEVYDSGQGMDEARLDELRRALEHPEEQETASHFGLISVVQRLNLFCGGRVKVTIDSKLGEFTSVRLTFPALPLRPPETPERS